MKIVHINSVYAYGSTGKIVENIHKNLLSKGLKSYVFFGRKQSNEKVLNVKKIGNIFTLSFHFLISRFFDLHGLGSVLPTLFMLGRIRKIKPDIIHLHNLHGYYLNYYLLFRYLRTSKAKIYWTLHDCWAFTGHCTHFESSNCFKWEKSCYKCPARKAYPKSIFFDNSKFNFQLKKSSFTKIHDLNIITPSKWLEKMVKKSFLSNFPCTVIPNGIDLSKFDLNPPFYPQKLLSLRNPFFVLAISNIWNEKKGLNDLVKLAKLFKGDEYLLVVGLKKSQFKNFDGFKQVICFERMSSFSQIKNIFTISNVFVNLTYEDTFPTVNIESLATGTPIITYDSGGSPEILTTESGYIVKKYDFNGVYEKVQLIKKNTKSFYSDACLKKAKEFTLNEHLDKYFNLYQG
jgi:glycosyltransferase involved in cell wall biosynthesis